MNVSFPCLSSTLLALLAGSLFPLPLLAQQAPTWDDPRAKGWPKACQKVAIPSTLDGTEQAAYFFVASGEAPRPLIVSLHTWSGGYDQYDTLAWMSVDRNYHYIHPHFRGPNNTPQACGSKYALQDMEDAIAYALSHARVDSSQIHVVGTSGGGHATLMAYVHTQHPVKTFSAWVPISDIYRWYQESVGRGNKYALDIALATGQGTTFSSTHHRVNAREARQRSPLFHPTPVERRQGSKLFLYAGIHDGYTGSVPITHSLHFFNKVVQDMDPHEQQALISQADMLELLASRTFAHPPDAMLGDRKVHYQRRYQDKVQLTLFEGGHEMIKFVSLDQVKARHVLVIGDSNGAREGGWVDQLQALCFEDFFFNASVSGNTLGFDNLGRADLNALRNVATCLQQAIEELGKLDDVLILLGTNDAKAVFDDRQAEVPQHLRQLIEQIKAHPVYPQWRPRLHVISPPPYGEDEVMLEKYRGGAQRVAALVPQFRQVATQTGCSFVDLHTPLRGLWAQHAPDGVHPDGAVLRLMAALIREAVW